MNDISSHRGWYLIGKPKKAHTLPPKTARHRVSNEVKQALKRRAQAMKDNLIKRTTQRWK